MNSTRREFLGSLGAAAVQRKARPNVLWIMTDEQRPDSLGSNGAPWAKSPAIDALAAEGALFESAYTPSPVCVPARSCLLTGRYGSSLGVLHNQQRLAAGTRFLTWVFEDAGYRTASFGKKHYFCEGRQAFSVEQGRATDEVVDATRYRRGHRAADFDAVVYPGPQSWILGGRFPGKIAETAEARNVDLALDWLGSLQRGDAFFLRVSLNAPHTPVVVPEPFAGSLAGQRIPPPRPVSADQPPWVRAALRDYQGSHRLSPEQLARVRRYYYERAAFLDSQIGRLLDRMRQRGALDHTIVALVSDHGAHLGDQGLFQKQTFYEQVATVPYLFHYPEGVRRGRRFRAPVTTLSLMPTLIDMAGLEVPRGTESASVAAHLRSGDELAEGPVFSEIKLGYRGYRDDDRLVMVRKGRHKMFVFPDGGAPEGALYDLAADPHELRNRFGDPAARPTVAALRAEIAGWDRERRQT
jgi:choline-sulfatase